MISQTAEYALRAVICLAEAGEAPRTTRELAEITRVPSGYLAKVLQLLAKAGIIRSQRGLGGGFTLDTAPDTLTVYDVLQAVDPIRRIRTCPLKIESHQRCLCPLHQKLDDALAAMEQSFRCASIAAMLQEDPHRKPLCRDPQSKVDVSILKSEQKRGPKS